MAPPPPSQTTYIRQRAAQLGLDPNAVMAVAAQEGLGGGIGDQGTSFGPWQLHYGGAYPSFAPHGSAASQQWAWSQAGINYALNAMNRVAHGLRGQAAVSNIVSRFERPANPGREISRALRAYGLPQLAAGFSQATGGFQPQGYGFTSSTPSESHFDPFQSLIQASQIPQGPARTEAYRQMFAQKATAGGYGPR